MPRRMMNVVEVARYLHMEPGQIEMLVRHHSIPCNVQGERATFERGEVDAWASQRILGMEARPLAAYHQDSSANTRDAGGQHVSVAQLLAPDRCLPEMQARTKSAVLRGLVQAAEAGGLTYDPKELLHSLEDREALCSTGLVGGIALVHPRHHDPYLVPESFLMLATVAPPILFGAPDGKPTDVFFLLCCQDDWLHLHALARLCSMIQATPMMEAIRDAASPDGMFEAVATAERDIVRRLR